MSSRVSAEHPVTRLVDVNSHLQHIRSHFQGTDVLEKFSRPYKYAVEFLDIFWYKNYESIMEQKSDFREINQVTELTTLNGPTNPL